MNYTEMFSVLSKPWASVNDIKLIASCGRDKAIAIRNFITKEIKDSGKHLPISKTKIVPTNLVIELNIEYITEMARKEKLVNQ